ncbi:MAG TPA: NADH-quinone oxidoreductase subunit NuoH [Anaerolineae bacterium]|nr:NADH-quinone oxidoreductase subunit NuoH [Anaerolineae bacterium]HNS52903.1 NADH-quinone oxidoreductase subunit NuoH [Anaerolineae bacterium]
MSWVVDFWIPLVKAVVVVLVLLASGAYATWAERKICARFQVRYGPNRAGRFGLLQPLADAVKAIFKEEIVPSHVDRALYVIAPGISFAAVLITFAVIPFGPEVELFGQKVGLWIGDVSVSLLYLLAIAGLAAYGVVLGGWSSNNKYSLLGALRAAAQMISYELPMGLALLGVVLINGSVSLRQIVDSQGSWPLAVLQPIGFLVFLVAILAEGNRSPFDLPETENELISGFMTEYGGMKFALYYVAEYTAMVVNAAITATIFLGGWKWPAVLSDLHPLVGVALFLAKVGLMVFVFIWIRASLPRVRYDKFMRFCWKFMVPLSLLNLAATAVVLAVMA